MNAFHSLTFKMTVILYMRGHAVWKYKGMELVVFVASLVVSESFAILEIPVSYYRKQALHGVGLYLTVKHLMRASGKVSRYLWFI